MQIRTAMESCFTCLFSCFFIVFLGWLGYIALSIGLIDNICLETVMHKMVMIVVVGLFFAGLACGGETSLAGFLTYWDGIDSSGQSIDGAGGGVKLRKKLLGVLAGDVRASYVGFSDVETSVMPLEATIMVGIPFILEPYAGIGAGYYFVDSDLKYENGAGGFGVLGVQFNMFVVGAMAEVRYNKVDVSVGDEYLMDGLSANVGIMIKW